ncbi:Aldehyde dehydrogenase, MaoC-like [Desulfonema limicola]|uniref:Aldehyde dehydrogenase, MaoC-like n=1 Tax=Desulfonema limicola TaxID=45656 RepID=A0A975GG95_9BACT|nr:MaoC/PaaZ C-terminal domain-containing protein [Desulfonema limicola]QTA80051.1 Aldehyde dehydrogenase, MaoC-like [Desulfonema limicola]
MPLNLDALNKNIEPVTKDYNWKDAVLYALGVGAGFDDLDYCYEKHLKIIPSFSAAMIIDFFFHAALKAEINLAGLLHGEQKLIFHAPIPAEGRLTTKGCISNYYDKGKDKGALVIAESDTFHSNGQKLFTSIMTLFARLDGGFGGENAPKQEVVFPDKEPDFISQAFPSPDQPLLYRLSGDLFDLHVDPGFAEKAGFEMPIMHGLCTHGYACRALVKNLIPGRPEKLKQMSCRFSKPLYPGIPIKTLIWITAPGKAVWRTINSQTQDIVIDQGTAEYEPV